MGWRRYLVVSGRMGTACLEAGKAYMYTYPRWGNYWPGAAGSRAWGGAASRRGRGGRASDRDLKIGPARSGLGGVVDFVGCAWSSPVYTPAATGRLARRLCRSCLGDCHYSARPHCWKVPVREKDHQCSGPGAPFPALRNAST